MSGTKSMLTIRQWNTQTEAAESLVFTAMLNPAKYSRSRSVQYTAERGLQDGELAEKRVKTVTPDTLELDELILDGTGAVDAPGSAGDVDAQVALLRRVLHDPMGDQKVRYAVVEILWGTMSFQGRLTAMNVSYTLFSAAGTPLRARVKLSFVAYEKSTAQLATGVAAVDARKIRLVVGDTLPMLCFTVYNDATLAAAVALFNGLSTIRHLAPGMSLTLPKLG